MPTMPPSFPVVSSSGFLDEPTASLDAIATEQIKNSLDAIKKGRTVVIISHSLSQILDADCIYVMKEGTVVESGSHEELISLHGTYREIFDASARSLNLDKLISSMTDQSSFVRIKILMGSEAAVGVLSHQIIDLMYSR